MKRKTKLSLKEWNQMAHKWIRRKSGALGQPGMDHDPKCPCGIPEPKPEFRKV